MAAPYRTPPSLAPEPSSFEVLGMRMRSRRRHYPAKADEGTVHVPAGGVDGATAVIVLTGAVVAAFGAVAFVVLRGSIPWLN